MECYSFWSYKNCSEYKWSFTSTNMSDTLAFNFMKTEKGKQRIFSDEEESYWDSGWESETNSSAWKRRIRFHVHEVMRLLQKRICWCRAKRIIVQYFVLSRTDVGRSVSFVSLEQKRLFFFEIDWNIKRLGKRIHSLYPSVVLLPKRLKNLSLV
jgi:hypothetical protein